MKRTNVVLDEKLLEEARTLTGERTYSATINRALAEMARKLRLEKHLEWAFNGEDHFYPGYAEELYGEEWVKKTRAKLDKKFGPPPKPKAVAAMTVSEPKKRRGSGR